MKQAAALDLSYFEDAAFYDKLERAGARTSDRSRGNSDGGGIMFQRTIALISLASAVIWYSPWLFWDITVVTDDEGRALVKNFRFHAVVNRGSSPCRGATPFVSVDYKRFLVTLYRFCTVPLRVNK